MSLSQTGAKTVYIVSGLIIVSILVLLANSLYKSRAYYTKNAAIAVNTSRGMIRMNAASLAEELAKYRAEFARHAGYERTSKFEKQIDQVLDQLKQFINKNPRNNLCKGEIRASIINNAMADRITPHAHDQHLAHATILSHDDLEYGTTDLKFDYFLKHIDVLIGMLSNEVCDGGVLDLVALENLLRSVDSDLTAGIIHESQFVTDYDTHATNYKDPYAVTNLSLFESRVSQTEGLSVEMNTKKMPKRQSETIGAQNARDAQQRSQMFRENRKKLGIKHYVDEDLLFNPTYDLLAL